MTEANNTSRFGGLSVVPGTGAETAAVPFGPPRLRRDVEILSAALFERLGDPALSDAVSRTLQRCGRGFRRREPAVAPTGTVAPLHDLPSSWSEPLRIAMADTLPSPSARTDFLTWFLWDRLPGDGGPPLGWRLFVGLRGALPLAFARVARSLWLSHYNVYEVLDTDGRTRLDVRDLVFGESSTLHDSALAIGLRRWDLLVARLVRGEGTAVVHSLHSVLPPGARASLERVVHGLSRPARLGAPRQCVLSQIKRQPCELLHRCARIFEECAEPPDLTNLDGESLVDTCLYFRVNNRACVRAALERSPFLERFDGEVGVRAGAPAVRGMGDADAGGADAGDADARGDETGAVHFAWLREGRRPAGDHGVRPVLGTFTLDDRYVVVACNSRERGIAFHAGVERLVGCGARYVSTVHTDFEQRLLFRVQAHGEHPWPDEMLVGDAPLSRSLLQVYRQWLDAPLVAGTEGAGFTPREAMRSGTGRWWLARHLNRLDTVQLRAGGAPVPIFFDLDVIRRLLSSGPDRTAH